MTHLPELQHLVLSLHPERTVLMLGARAARPSDAPTGLELCRHLEEQLVSGERNSDDLADVASVLERRVGREKQISAVIGRLKVLVPDGALLGLARQPWISIYSTNYDLLVERTFKTISVDLAIIRHSPRVGLRTSTPPAGEVG